MKLTLIVFFIFLLSSVGGTMASARWDDLSARETRLLENGSMQEGVDEDGVEYVIVVGTHDKPEVVQAF